MGHKRTLLQKQAGKEKREQERTGHVENKPELGGLTPAVAVTAPALRAGVWRDRQGGQAGEGFRGREVEITV